MNIKRIYYIFLLIVFYIVPGQLPGQTLFYSTIGEKLKSIKVDSLSIEEKVAFLLLSDQKDSSDPDSKWENPIIPSNTFLNVIDGFYEEGTSSSFPDARAIKSVNDPKLREILKYDLLNFSAKEGHRFILSSDQYLFKEVGFPIRSTPDEFDFALWVLSGHHGEAIRIPALKMPELLFEKNISVSRMQRPDSKKIFNSWNKKDFESTLISFENTVSDGVFFISEDAARDRARLVRAYKNKMLVEEDLTMGCRKVLKALKEVENNIVPDNDVSFPVSELARRSSLENAIRVFQKTDKSFFPSDLTNVKVDIWSDTGEDATVTFTNLLQFHIPVGDSFAPEASHVLWLVDGQTLSDSVVQSGIRKIRDRYPYTKIAMVLVSPDDYFKNRSIPLEVDAVFSGTSDYPVVWESLAQAVVRGLDIRFSPTHETWFSGIKQHGKNFRKTRVKFGIPEEAAMHRDSLLKIDSIMAEAIKTEATPGGQVLVARDGIIVWSKNYGHHSYQEKRRVESHHLYDLASVTKIAATVPSLMKLYEKELWTLEDTLGLFFPQTDTTEKSGISMRELLLHESGLSSFIPFYQKTIDKDKLNGSLFGRRYSWLYNIKLDDYIYLNRTVRYRKDVFQKARDEIFNIPVAQNYFMNKHYLDSIMFQVIESPMRTRHSYLYSDLGFYFLGQMIPRLTGISMNQFTNSVFYEPMGMHRTSFLPALEFPAEEIVPTEQDKAFRRQLIHGWVHDPGAAMMGGVAGHAGLFSNATDMAKMMEMFLNKGTYGGKRYFNESTIEYFTKCHSEKNRRGFGFDKPETDTSKVSPSSIYASPKSFGHSGFTGTLVWADPESDLVYIFLSNRVHPNQYNKKLIKENFRTRVQDVIYKAIIKPGE